MKIRIFEDMYRIDTNYKIVELSAFHEHVKYVHGVDKIKYKYTFFEYLRYLYVDKKLNIDKNLDFNKCKCILSNKQFELFQALQNYANQYQYLT
jgi:hypothetical protein